MLWLEHWQNKWTLSAELGSIPQVISYRPGLSFLLSNLKKHRSSLRDFIYFAILHLRIRSCICTWDSREERLSWFMLFWSNGFLCFLVFLPSPVLGLQFPRWGFPRCSINQSLLNLQFFTLTSVVCHLVHNQTVLEEREECICKVWFSGLLSVYGENVSTHLVYSGLNAELFHWQQLRPMSLCPDPCFLFF